MKGGKMLYFKLFMVITAQQSNPANLPNPRSRRKPGFFLLVCRTLVRNPVPGSLQVFAFIPNYYNIPRERSPGLTIEQTFGT